MKNLEALKEFKTVRYTMCGREHSEGGSSYIREDCLKKYPEKVENYISTGPRIEKLIEKFPKLVVEYEDNCWSGNRFRGGGSDSSKFVIDSREKVRLGIERIEACFNWIDKGWGSYHSCLDIYIREPDGSARAKEF